MKRLPGCSFCSLCLALALAAQEAPPPPAVNAGPVAPTPPTQVRPRGTEIDPGAMFRLSRQMDTNGDLLVDENELNDGFQKFTEEAAAAQKNLLAWLDKDNNGTLTQEEWRPFYAVMALLPLIRSADQNNDLVLQEAEQDAAFTRMAEFCQSANDRVLQQFDRDHDGKLGEEELKTARQAMQRPGGGRGPRTGGGPDGAGGPPPGAEAPRPGGGGH